jgi:hypothetical protein
VTELQESLFNDRDGSVCIQILNQINPQTREFPFRLSPVDGQRMFMGIRNVFKEQKQHQVKEQIILAIAKIGQFVDSLEYGTLVDEQFLNWALSSELAMPNSMSALFESVFCAMRYSPNSSNPLAFLNSVFRLARRSIDCLDAAPFDKIEQTMRLILFCHPFFDNDQLRLIGRLTFHLYNLQDATDILRNQIVHFWVATHSAILCEVLVDSFSDSFRPNLSHFLLRLALLPELEINERIWEFVRNAIPLPLSELNRHKRGTLNLLTSAIRHFDRSALLLAGLNQQMICYQEVDVRIGTQTFQNQWQFDWMQPKIEEDDRLLDLTDPDRILLNIGEDNRLLDQLDFLSKEDQSEDKGESESDD